MSSIAIYSRRATTAWALKPYSLRATICCQATTVYGRSIQLPYRFYSGNNASNTSAKTQRYPHIQQGTALLGGVLLLAWISYNTFDNEDKRHLHENRPKYATRRGMDRAVEDIRQHLGEDAVSTDDEILKAHGYSEWSSINVDMLPVAVVFPSCTEDVVKIATVCSKYKIPLIPYSGGSSVEGHFSAPFGGVSVDFVHMKRIIAFHPEDMDIVVQPAVSWMDLNSQIRDSGLFFPIDPGPTAQIGGMIGTNCSGTNAVRYGTMKDWIVNMTVVLADGTVLKTRLRPRKSSAGYNLNEIFVGSEGTLGFVTEATLKLARIPEQTGVAVVTFPSMKAAATAATEIVRNGIPVGAVELLDDVQMSVINRVGATDRVWETLPTLFLKFCGTEAGVQDDMSRAKNIVEKNGGMNFQVESDEMKQNILWSARKEALWSMLSLRKTGNGVWTTDVAVPLSKVSELVELSKQDLDNLGLFGSMLGHIGDGNFHETILFDSEKEREIVKKCVYDMMHRAIEMEGTCTGEHGIGLGKKSFLVKEVGENSVQVMRMIKMSLDPNWIMNPGKIFDP